MQNPETKDKTRFQLHLDEANENNLNRGVALSRKQAEHMPLNIPPSVEGTEQGLFTS